MQTQDTTASSVVTLNDYLEVFARRKLLIAGCVLVMGLVALVFSMLKTPNYTAEAEVLVQPPLLNPLDGAQRVDLLINMKTETEVAASISVAELAAQRMGAGTEGRALIKRLTVTEVPDSQILRFSVVHSDPERAALAANELAQSYLDWRKGVSEQSSNEALATVQQQATEVEGRLAETNAILDRTDPESSAYRAAQIDRDVFVSDLATLRRQLARAAQLGTSPGEVIDRAEVPSSASSPNVPMNVIVGLILGALIGVVAAFFRDRTDDRLVQRKDSLELLGMRVLGTVPRPEGTSLVQTGGAVAEAHRRLTSNVSFLAESMGAKVLLVTSPNLGAVTPSIAGHVAASAARVGKKVLIVSANLRNSELDRIFSVQTSPGLVGVLIGELMAEAAVRTNSRFPRLDVMPAGRPVAQPAELLQTPAFRYFVTTQRENYDLVVIEAPAVNDYADALAIAPLVDGVVLMVEDGRSTKSDVEYAKGQLQRIGATIVGTVRVTGEDRSFGRRQQPTNKSKTQRPPSASKTSSNAKASGSTKPSGGGAAKRAGRNAEKQPPAPTAKSAG